MEKKLSREEESHAYPSSFFIHFLKKRDEPFT